MQASISDSWQQRHSSHSQSSTPGASSANNSAAHAQQQHVAAAAAAAGPPCSVINGHTPGHLTSRASAGVSHITNPQAPIQPGWLNSQQQQQQQQAHHSQQDQCLQQQQQHGSVGRFGSGSFSSRLGSLRRSGSLGSSSRQLVSAFKGLLQGSRDAAAAAPAAADKDASAPTAEKDCDAVQQQQDKRQQNKQQRHRRESKHIELPPSGRDELLTYPGSNAAEHTPEKGEVEVCAGPTCLPAFTSGWG
jgi:hypothetical protein